MKNLVFFFLLIAPLSGYSQSIPMAVFSAEKDIETIDEPPLYRNQPIEHLRTFVAQNYQYPRDAFQSGIEGIILVEFIIERDGEIGDVKVVRKLCASCDKEALRVVKKLRGFTPARTQGAPVRSKLRLPIHLLLQ